MVYNNEDIGERLPLGSSGKGGDACLNWLTKYLSAVLAVILLVQFVPLPAAAEEMEPISQQEILETEPAVADDPEVAIRETLPEETEAVETMDPTEETEPGQTLPDETIPEETLTDETIPEETIPEETEPEVLKTYNSVPLYFQNDYPEDMFGSGTVATSGCSITCLAMVATYLTGHEYLPNELARYFGGRAENNMARMEYGIKKMKLPYYKARNWHIVLEALGRGDIAILLLDDRSIFTDSQHFVVLTGITEEGLIMVNDSNADNYERWDLKDKLINGFPESDIWPGYNGAWVFSKSRMPKVPYLYKEEVVKVDPRYVGVTLTMDEREMLARMVWVEARGEPFEGQQAVAEVVLNRLVAPNFQGSIEDIIMAEGQFNSAKFLDEAEPYQSQYEAVERALKGPYILPITTVYFAQDPPVSGTLWGRIGGHYFSTQWLGKK